MNRLFGFDGWHDWARPTALVATLALLAAPAWAAEGSTAAQRASGSRYAARQVRLPAEAAPAKAAPAKAASQAKRSSQVRQAAHAEMATPSSRVVRSGYGRTPRTASAYRASNLRHAVGDHSVMVQEGEVMMEGEIMMEGEAMMPEQLPPPEGAMLMEDGQVLSHPGAGHLHGGIVEGGCHGGACNDCGTCATCCLIPCPKLSFDNFEFFAGADAFSGPLNRGEGGSFGFHEGVNWGHDLPCGDFLSVQLGAQAVQSTFSGNDITDEDRRQFFVTGGFFRRVDWGLQGGAVIDMLHDEWYYDPLDLAQVRGELSWVFPCNHELGLWVTQSFNNGTSTSLIQTGATTTTTLSEGWHSTDLYAAFYRRHFLDCNANGRLFAGFTDNSDGLVGADFNVPIAENWALRTDFTYLIPAEGQSQAGHVEESWNVSLGIVWYPGCRTARSSDYHRPLFNVANNGSFMVDRD